MLLSIAKNLTSRGDSFFQKLSGMTTPWLEGLAARIVFLSVLFQYYLQSALTKFDGLMPNAGAYAQIFPEASRLADYDPSNLGFLHHLVVFFGSYGELILPVLIVTGLFARLASAGMIVFIIVQSIVDIWGHLVKGGQPFDAISTDVIADQRLLWVFLLLIIVLRGAGALSIDGIIRKLMAAPVEQAG